jgi:hypothetical protein
MWPLASHFLCCGLACCQGAKNRICNVPPGTYIVHAEKDGYLVERIEITVEESRTTIADISMKDITPKICTSR